MPRDSYHPSDFGSIRQIFRRVQCDLKKKRRKETSLPVSFLDASRGSGQCCTLSFRSVKVRRTREIEMDLLYPEQLHRGTEVVGRQAR